MDDVRCLHHVARRQQEATMIVDSFLARRSAHRLADQMLRTSTRIAELADDALDATIALMWFDVHLDLPGLKEATSWNVALD